MKEFIWSEMYRPKKVSECILPDRLKKPFQSYVDKKEIPNLMLSGSTGVGKTTIAIAMCEEIGVNYLFMNSSDERRIEDFRVKVKNYASTLSLAGGQKVIILDEADSITPEAQLAFRGIIEKYSDHCTFILTCNYKSKLIEAIHSRIIPVEFNLKNSEKPALAAEFFRRVEGILNENKVKYDKKVVAAIVQKFFPDFRRTLNELQHMVNTYGELNPSVIDQITDIQSLKDLFGFLKEGKFKDMRKWVVQNNDVDTPMMVRKIYESLNDFLKPEFIPQAILILAKYQYQSAFVADQEINTVSMLTEMMVDCEFA